MESEHPIQISAESAVPVGSETSSTRMKPEHATPEQPTGETAVLENKGTTAGSNGRSMAKSRADMSEEEKARLKAEKKAKKEAEKRAKKEKKAASARAAAIAAEKKKHADTVEFMSIENEPEQMFGTLAVIQSKCPEAGSGRTFVPVSGLTELAVGDNIWVRARLHKVQVKGKLGFLTLRSDLDTVQAVLDGKEMSKWAQKSLTAESIVDIKAEIAVPDGGAVAKCTVGRVELRVLRIYIVSRAEPMLPLTLEDAARPLDEDEKEYNEPEEGGEQRRPTVTRDTRLNNRVIDVRVAPHMSILRVQSMVSTIFREYLHGQGFVEIHSPKLIAGSSEGGSDVFKLDYFGRECCLAQSPQLYKQMAICADLGRVYEVGPVFRAEKSNTHRHMTEFTGLDLEMEIKEHYYEALDVIESLFVSIFEGVEERCGRELKAVRTKWAVPPFKHLGRGNKQLRLKWPEGIAMLREAGVEIGDFEDLSTAQEKILGKLVKEKYGTDFFTLTHFPSAIRPFYTMVDPTDARYSNSYDIFMRGEEIVSGAQRIHDVELLKERATAMLGEEGLQSISSYVDAFRFGAPPHAGCGIGMERVVMLYLGVGNIRECSFFPRDPGRLTP